MFTVFVEGLEFYAYHGVPAEERAIGHRYTVDLEMVVEGEADRTDDIHATADYAKASQTLEAIAKGQQVKTLERLARLMADAILKDFASVMEVRVRLAKPLPPSPVIANMAGVEVTATR
jgi:7,8-dihydroneopterin aldolase/epimerase/oxygenase